MKQSDEEEADTAGIEFGGLEHSVGFLVSILHSCVYEHIQDGLGDASIRPAAMSVLLVIGANPGIRHGTVARVLHVKLAYLTKLIKAHEAQGIVKRRQPERDKRVVQLYLTEKGMAYTRQKGAQLLNHDSKRPDGLTADERADLARLLRKSLYIAEPGATAN